MRNYSNSAQHLEHQIIQFFEKLSIQKRNEIFSEVNRPRKPQYERTLSGVLVGSQKYHDLIRVLLLYHFGEEYREGIKAYLCLGVLAKLDRNFEFHWMNILFENKYFFLRWLVLSDTLSSRSFFGSVLNLERMLVLIESIIIQFVSEIRKPVKRNQFIRGYRDKGSLKDPSSKARQEADSFPDYNQIVKVLEREKVFSFEREVFRKVLILGDRTLNPELLVKFRILKKEDIIYVEETNHNHSS